MCHDVAFTTFLLTMGALTGVIYRFGPESFTFIYERWIGFVTASIAMSVFQGVLCYLFSFRKGALLALGGNSGNPIYDVRFLFQFVSRGNTREIACHAKVTLC